MMPRMRFAPFDGVEVHGKVGPLRLFMALASVSMRPILEAPWEASAETAYLALPEIMQRELENKLQRRMQGRRY